MISAAFSSFIGNAPFQMEADAYQRAGFELTFGDDRRLERLVKGDHQIVAASMNSVLMNLEVLLGNAQVIYAYVKAIGNGSDLIVCRGGVQDAEHLAGLRIGVQKASLEHFIFEYLFFLHGIKRRHEYSWLARSEYGRAMKAEEIDAAVFCDPALSQILQDGRFRLFDGDMKEVVLTATGVLIVRTDMLSEGKDRIRKFISILSDGIRAIQSADDHLLTEKGSTFFEGIESPKKKLLSEVAFLGLDDNRKLFAADEEDSLFIRGSVWLDFLKASGLHPTLGKSLTVSDILDPSIVESL